MPKPTRTRRLTDAQQRLVGYLDDVGAATEAGLYHAGLSDATGRTLRSLIDRGAVVQAATLATSAGTLPVYVLRAEGDE